MTNPRELSVVLIAGSLNVSIFRDFWLVDNGIFSREELETAQTVYSPVAVDIRTPSFEFLAVQERLQVRVLDEPAARDIFRSRFASVVEKLPHTPILGAGFNFIYELNSTEPDQLAQKFKTFAINETSELVRMFSKPDARFGLYLSEDLLDKTARLRLDIKPSRNTQGDCLVLSFNFHRDLTKANEVMEFVDCWNQFHERAVSVVQTITRALEG